MRGLRVFAAALACFGVLCFAVVPGRALAYDPLDTACSSTETKDSPTCASRTTKNPLTGSDGLLMRITYVIAAIAGFTAVLIIIISGSRYMTAGGDAKKATDARNALIGALVGLAIISLAGLIIMFVVSRIE